MTDKRLKDSTELEESEIENNDYSGGTLPYFNENEELAKCFEERTLLNKARLTSCPQRSSPRKALIESYETCTQRTVSILSLSSAISKRSTSGGRTPPNVKRLRDPKTGYFDRDKLTEEAPGVTGSRQHIVSTLTILSRMYRDEVQATDRGKTDRMTALLKSKPNLVEKLINTKNVRYIPRLTASQRFRYYRPRLLQPQSPSAPDLTDSSFHRTIKEMQKEKWATAVMPTGRMAFGDISRYKLTDMHRSLEWKRIHGRLDDLHIPGIDHESAEHWKPREVAFSHRLRSLTLEERQIYYALQSESNPYLSGQRGIDRRMVPKPTIAMMLGYNDRKVKQLFKRLKKTQHLPQSDKRQLLFERSVLQSAINVHSTKPLTTISENEFQPYTYDTYDFDPKTNLIPTTKSEDERIEREERVKTEEMMRSALLEEERRRYAVEEAEGQRQSYIAQWLQQEPQTLEPEGSSSSDQLNAFPMNASEIRLRDLSSTASTSAAQPRLIESPPRLSRSPYYGRRSRKLCSPPQTTTKQNFVKVPND